MALGHACGLASLPAGMPVRGAAGPPDEVKQIGLNCRAGMVLAHACWLASLPAESPPAERPGHLKTKTYERATTDA
jgi:hypothetical protein